MQQTAPSWRRLVSRWLTLLCVAILLAACSGNPLNSSNDGDLDACLDALPRPAEFTGLFVAPDDGERPVLDELHAARCTIDVSVYLLSDDTVIAALDTAADRGVRVRVMLEEHPFGGGGTQDEVRAALEAHEIEVRWSGSGVRFSHAKFIVVDRQTALIMNQNLTVSAFTNNREFGVVTTNRASVTQAQQIFDRDWESDGGEHVDGPLIVSPANSRDRLLALIEGATESIDLYAEVIRDEQVVAALGAAAARGVEVRLIVDVSIDEDTQNVAARLYAQGVEIRLADFLCIHAKLMVIDGELAVVGSQNFTQTSLDQNREVAMVVTDPLLIERCLAVFERDWQRSAPGAPGG